MTFLLFANSYFFLSNISDWLYKNKKKISTSNGTFCIKKKNILDFKLVTLILPSKKKKNFFLF
jgi:hypothetical protein